MNNQVIVKKDGKEVTSNLTANDKFVVGFLKRMDKGCVIVQLPDGTSFQTGTDRASICADIKITDPRFSVRLNCMVMWGLEKLMWKAIGKPQVLPM